jgi:pyrimidine-nucleoside phosphorylase
MRAQDLIEKKRDGGELQPEELAWLIRKYTSDEVPDYQMAAWLMAVFLNGMTTAETRALVEQMLQSGEVITHPEISAPKVDKHSTGGVGDKTSIVIAPVVAACNVAVPMISGRALAHTGGTLDKLEAIPGFRTDLSLTEFRSVLARCGLALIGQTREIAPADRKLYALRDLTATVPSRPLMCASIMSKKLAEGIDGLVLDVKVGNGAFMREMDSARQLAQMMCEVGRDMGKKTRALITDMNQPLGRKVGNAVETAEAIEALAGVIEGDFGELCLDLSAQMLIVAGVQSDEAAARKQALEAINSGRALECFGRVIEAQGGDPRVLEDPSLLPHAHRELVVNSVRSGWVTGIETDELGRIVMEWGGGRSRLGESIDLGVGLAIEAKIGSRIERGEPLVRAFFNDESRRDEMKQRLEVAFHVGGAAPIAQPLVKEIIE